MDAKRHKVDVALQKVVQRATCPKAAIARILQTLHEEGLLAPGVASTDGVSATKCRLSRLSSDLANRSTPFGKLIQSIQASTLRIEVIHPMALIFALSEESPKFRALMLSIIGDGRRPLRIVLFIDEMTLGNVLRPDLGRAVQDLFWTFVDFPGWFLVRQDAWFVFTALRSVEKNKLSGSVSELMKHVVHTFWSQHGPNFATSGGALFVSESATKVFLAYFVGFIGDEMGLKGVFQSKGPAGTRCCIQCKNIVQFLDAYVPASGILQSISCHDRHLFQKSTDADIYWIVDALTEMASGPKGALNEAQKVYGINFEPFGILFDQHCRSIVRPTVHWLRDWMHVMCVSGCANIEIQQLLVTLKQHGVPLEAVSTFASHITLPAAHGKVNPDWFTIKRIGKPAADKDGWKGFSSEILTIVPLLWCFLNVVVVPLGILDRHIECFKCLHLMLALFRSGPECAAQNVDNITAIIDRHADLFGRLYKSRIKPKYHHLFHIPDHAIHLGKLLSCFVTERKHRSVKSQASHTFGNFERSLLIETVGRNLDAFKDDSIFTRESLLQPKPVEFDNDQVAALIRLRSGVSGKCFVATHARLITGQISRGELVMKTGNVLGELHLCLSCEIDGRPSILLLLRLHRHVEGDKYSKIADEFCMVESGDVWGAVMWCVDGEFIRVVPPPLAYVLQPQR